ncbi:MAG: tail fiber protein [Proteobacteria bacterium]|nr:tail fiber protein [Pseudomonadota bacterium]
MPKNGLGIYSPPPGTSPITPNTLADATKMEARLVDIGTELTNSLPRNGAAPMLAPLPLQPGTAMAPALTFVGDLDSGIALIGGRICFIKDGVTLASFSATEFAFPKPVTFQEPATFAAGMVSPLVMKPGMLVPYSGVLLPDGYLWANGQAVSRSTYADLLAATTAVITATTTSGSPTLTAVSVDHSASGLVNAVIEGAGIPPGTTANVVAAGTITMSGNASASASGVTIRLLPNGAGDGSTTFNVFDAKGRALFGRDNMGGTAANRLTNQPGGINGLRLGSGGGAETHILTIQQMAQHDHDGIPEKVTVPRTGWGTAGGPLGMVAAGQIVVGSGGFEGSESLESLRASGNDQELTLTGDIATDPAGGGAAHNNVPPGAVANYLVKY